jgi:hypothetical protein
MDKERISIVSFGQQYLQCCSIACFSVFKQYKRSPRKMGRVCRASKMTFVCQDEGCIRKRDLEATFFISATLRPADWERKKFSCARFFCHDTGEATDKSHTQHLIQYISYW